MKILLDECLPRRLGQELAGHHVMTVPERGWAGITNGDLLALIDDEFDVFVTVDQNLVYQQNLKNVPFGVIVLSAATNQLEDLQPLVPAILEALETVQEDQIVNIEG